MTVPSFLSMRNLFFLSEISIEKDVKKNGWKMKNLCKIKVGKRQKFEYEA